MKDVLKLVSTYLSKPILWKFEHHIYWYLCIKQNKDFWMLLKGKSDLEILHVKVRVSHSKLSHYFSPKVHSNLYMYYIRHYKQLFILRHTIPFSFLWVWYGILLLTHYAIDNFSNICVKFKSYLKMWHEG